jgi:purine nucleoside permease
LSYTGASYKEILRQNLWENTEINAATSAQALWQSDYFDLSESYFLIAGIAGINPNQGSLGDVTLQRFAVQVNLQYEIDIRELGENYSTPYIPYGAKLPAPLQYPGNYYGTEVFELNVALRDKVRVPCIRASLLRPRQIIC